MKIEDFTSQQLSDKADFVSDVSIGHVEEIGSEETVSGRKSAILFCIVYFEIFLKSGLRRKRD